MNKTDHTEENFAELYENSFSDMQSFEPGQSITTEIVSISGDCIFLKLSGKSEGQMDASEMIGSDGELTVKEGDQITVFYMSSKNGVMYFTTRISGDAAGQAVLENAFESGIPVEGVVEKEIKGGFEIKLGDTRAFCPFSQMGMKRIENPQEYIGKNVTFKIIEHGERGRNILVSNRVILEEEHNKQVEELKKTLQENMDVKGTVKSIQDFGAFVEIYGIQALLPISEISRSRVEDISEILSPGQEIEARIIKLDWRNERITLSMKALLDDPWEEADKKYKIGSKHEGEVVRLTNFGAFVALEPGLDGLVHISEFDGGGRDQNIRNILKSGQKIPVEIKSIDMEKKRISLKPETAAKVDAESRKYLEPESDTYNPFAALLKEKESKTGKK